MKIPSQHQQQQTIKNNQHKWEEYERSNLLNLSTYMGSIVSITGQRNCRRYQSSEDRESKASSRFSQVCVEINSSTHHENENTIWIFNSNAKSMIFTIRIKDLAPRRVTKATSNKLTHLYQQTSSLPSTQNEMAGQS
uniref:Uncharacterized protein n=1 Tax=Trichobilharzia regenti TaxID=157069 RepID=A0AA85J0C8_TRIRE|nr:unnamed protein product [Trichobilharzia regenti]